MLALVETARERAELITQAATPVLALMRNRAFLQTMQRLGGEIKNARKKIRHDEFLGRIEGR